MTSCFICHANNLITHLDYQACPSCGHQILDSIEKTGTVINDDLSFARLSKADGLVKAQIKLALSLSTSRTRLIDIGCGSGRFLYHIKNKFQDVHGVEMDTTSRHFAENKFSLSVTEYIPQAKLTQTDLVTFWHSFEHIPPIALADILKTIHTHGSNNIKILLSVPNAASWQYKIFGRAYAYYDVPAHLHQFTPQSLNQFLSAYGFVLTGTHLMTSYILFGWIQGLLNQIFPYHNYLYYRLKRGWTFGLTPYKRFSYDALSMLALPFAVALGVCLTTMECFNSARQGVITASYQKRALPL